MRMLCEELQKDLVNHIINHMFDMIKQMINNSVNDALSKLGASNQPIQRSSMALGYVPNSSLCHNAGRTS